MLQLTFLSLAQAFALTGSAGQGALCPCHCRYVESASITPAPANTSALYSEIAVTHGTALIKPANVAPMPKVTNRAGSAQQIKVPVLVNKLSVGTIVCFHMV